MPERYPVTLRGAVPEDVSDILRFFELANDPNVLPRSEEDYGRSVENGLFYVVESDDQLIAAAGLFYLNAHDNGPLEMGSCFVAPDARGFGLQKLLALPRIASATIFYDQNEPIYTAIKPDNAPSLKSITDMGFEPLTSPIPLLVELCITCKSRTEIGSRRICCYDFFHIAPRKRCEAVSKLLKSRTVSLRRKDGAVMEVEMNVQLLNVPAYRSALQEFVRGPSCNEL
jgi:GNAT superfamily N-acetyltransferase